MLPRREHEPVPKPMQPHETPEIDTAYARINLTPLEIDTTPRLLPELAAVQREPFELPPLDMGPNFGAQQRDFADIVV